MKKNKNNLNPAFHIFSFYVIIGIIWIVFSDKIVNHFITDRDALYYISLSKGWFFVIFTGLLFYFSASRYFKKQIIINKRLNLILETSKALTWRYNFSNKCFYFDRNFHKAFGYQQGFLNEPAERIKNLIHQDEFQGFTRKLHALREGEYNSFENIVRIRTKHNKWRSVFTRVSVIDFDKKNNPLKVQGIVIDISDQIKNAKALAESKEQYRFIYENTSVAIIEISFSELVAELQNLSIHNSEELDSYIANNQGEELRLLTLIKIKKANKAALKLFKARSFFQFSNSLNKVLLAESFEQNFKLVKMIADKKRNIKTEISYKNLEGSYFYAHLNIYIHYEKDNYTSLISLLDITESKLNKEKLFFNIQKYRDLFISSLDSIFILDDDGRFLDINPAGIKLFGLNSEELNDYSISTIIQGKPDFSELKQSLTLNFSISNIEIHFLDNSNKIASGLLSASIWQSSKESDLSYQFILKDVTSYEILQHQLYQSQKMEAVGLLANGIAHDFNNILSIINGYVGLIELKTQNQNLDIPEISEILEVTERGALLTKNILAFSKKDKLSKEIITINEIIDRNLNILNRIIEEDIEIVIDKFEEDIYLNVDPVQFEQMILNMIVNSRDSIVEREKMLNHSFKKRIRISLNKIFLFREKAEKYNLEEKFYLELKISDSGIGVPHSVKKKIYDPFFTTKENGKGTGLGLSIVYRIISQNKAAIDLESKLGETCFTILWPVEDDGFLQSKEANLITFQKGNREKILFVEDEDNVRILYSQLLIHANYNVFQAANGKMALEILAEKNNPAIDILVTDFLMPEMGGLELYQKLLKSYPDLPVLFMTGYESKYKKLKDEGYETLKKPFTLDDLTYKIKSLL